VDGARVVAGWPGASTMAPERIGHFAPQVEACGVELVDSPQKLFGKVDGVLILSLCGAAHRERAAPFLEAGVPVYVDKPFACDLADADAMLALAARHRTPLFHASALRFADDVTAFRNDAARCGALLGLVSYGPAWRAEQNPGLLHYGIHAIEVLYALMGTGCESVAAVHTEGADLVTGRWSDGRLASMRGSRTGATAYGVLAFCERGVIRRHISAEYAYRNLCREIVQFFGTGEPPVPHRETREVTRFALAALDSERRGGAWIDVEKA
jgi:predicted dehydrogenase